jgi:uncharacterized iron-regulated protein
MTNVKIDNYRFYMEMFKQRTNKRLEDIKEKAVQRKAEYEDKFLAHWFRWKWEDSSDFMNFNDGYWERSQNKRIDKELIRIEYHEKLGDTLIPFNKEHFWLDDFYKFAKENGLP